MSISFPPLLTRVCQIIQMGGNRGKSWTILLWGGGGEVPNSVIKYFLHLEYDKF